MRRSIHINRRALFVACLLLTLIAAAGLAGEQLLVRPEAQTGGFHRVTTGPKGGPNDPDLAVVDPAQGGVSEADMLASRDAYWNARYTYPTGSANRAWMFQALDQANKIPSGVPDGAKTYTAPNKNGPNAGNQPLITMNPSAWTSIGPQPQDSETCQACFAFGLVAGRVNDIVVDPITPTIAYIGVDGGGVWKSTNCCNALTSWTFTMNDPMLSTLTIGTLALDPKNHYIYAGTGDLTFGSFSFGSAGLLKSTDGGTTWQVKGADVFGMPYTQPAGQFPQYNSIGAVVIDPNNSNRLAVGTKTGVYFSYNGGDDWAGPCLPDPFPGQRQDITSMFALTRTNSLSDLFVAVGARGYNNPVEYNLGDNGANGIYKATFPSSGCPNDWGLISRPNNGWPAGTGSGVPQATPGGNPVGRIDMTYAPSDHKYLYAETQAIAPDPNLGAVQKGGMLGLFRSTDGGATWTKMATGQTLEDHESECGGDCVTDPLGVCGDYNQNWYDQRVAVDPTDPNFVLFDNDDVWRSTDGGATVQDITCGYASIQVHRQVHVDQHAIAFVPNQPGAVLIGNDGGVDYTANVRTEQGIYPTFAQLNSSLNTIEFYSGDISANFANSVAQYAVAGAQDNGSSSWPEDPAGATNTWGQRIGGDGVFARIEPVLGQRVYMETPNGGLRMSETGHRGPYPLLTAATNYSSDRSSFVFPYEIYKGVPATTPGGGDDSSCALPDGCMHMIAGTFRVWENTGGARATSPWVAVSPDLTKKTLGDRSFVNQLSFAPRTDKFAIAGTNDGNVWVGFNLGAPSTISSTWVNVTGNNAVLPNRPILDVAFDPTILMTSTNLVGYASVGGFNENTPSTPGHVFQVNCTLNCASATWVNKTGNLPNIPADSIIANPNYPKQVFVGTDWGVYFTNDITANPPTWMHFNAGMPNVMVWDFQIDRGFTTLSAFTRSRGAWVWPLPGAPFVPAASPSPTAGTPSSTPMTRTPAVPPSYTPLPTKTPQPSSTPIPCGSTGLLSEGFESGTLGVFSATTAMGNDTEGWRAVQSVYYRGSWSAYVPDNSVSSDQQLTLKNAINVPSSGTTLLQFYHRFNFETIESPPPPAPNTAYDGGVLEYSTDNGATWNDAGSLITEGGYNAVLGGGPTGNPLPETQIWGTESPGFPQFTRVTVDLTSLGGKSVKFRFREGSDQSGNTGDGWYIDDVNVVSSTGATCTPGPTSTGVPPTYTFTATPTVPAGSTATPTSTVCTVQFQDVPPSSDASSFYSYVRCLACRGVLGGYKCGGPGEPCGSTGNPYFRPGNNITRGQIAKVVANAAGFHEAVSGQHYADVPPSNDPSSFYQYIERLTNRGVMGGYPCGGPGEPCDNAHRPYFRPSSNATRGQLSKIVANTAGYHEAVSGQTFADVPPSTAASSFYQYVERLTRRGVMQGYPCGGPGEPCDNGHRPYFRPGNLVTRAQAAKIVANTFYPNCQTPARP